MRTDGPIPSPNSLADSAGQDFVLYSDREQKLNGNFVSVGSEPYWGTLFTAFEAL